MTDIAMLRTPDEAFLRQLDAHHRFTYPDKYPTHAEDELGVEFLPSDLDLSQVDFSAMDLAGLRWRNCDLDRSRFHDAWMPATHAYDTTWRQCDFSRAWLVKSEAEGCDFSRAIFRDANLIRFDVVRCDVRDADLSGAKLAKFSLADCDARRLRIHSTELDRLWLNGSHVAELDLTGCSGTITRPAGINIEDPEHPRWIDGDDALQWLQSRGAPELTFFGEPATQGE